MRVTYIIPMQILKHLRPSSCTLLPHKMLKWLTYWPHGKKTSAPSFVNQPVWHWRFGEIVAANTFLAIHQPMYRAAALVPTTVIEIVCAILSSLLALLSGYKRVQVWVLLRHSSCVLYLILNTMRQRPDYYSYLMP